MLEQLKESIRSHKSSFPDEIREEYQAYDQRYQSIQNENDNEIKNRE